MQEPTDYIKGRLYQSTRFVQHHEAQEAITHKELLPGTESMNGGKGLYALVVDKPAMNAWDEYEDCLIWHEFEPGETESGVEASAILNVVDNKISDAVTAAVALAQGGM